MMPPFQLTSGTIMTGNIVIDIAKIRAKATPQLIHFIDFFKFSAELAFSSLFIKSLYLDISDIISILLRSIA